MSNSRPTWQRIVGYLGWISLASVCLVMSCGVGVVVGLLMGEGRSYHRQFLEEQELCAPIIAADPAFARISIHKRSNGGVYLLGEVTSNEEFERLNQQMSNALGENRGRSVMYAVTVKNQSKITQ